MKITLFILQIILMLLFNNINLYSQEIFINEFLTLNNNGIIDEYGDNDDWIEIYNAGSESVNLGGLYITDNLDNPGEWQIPTTDPAKTTIAAGGYLILWADKEFEQGITHVEIKLSGTGEQIGISKKTGTEFIYIDTISFGVQVEDITYGRVTDGGISWQFFAEPTPGRSNIGTYTRFPEYSEAVSIYPNPSNGIVYIKNIKQGTYSVQLFDQNGRSKWISDYENTESINLNSFAEGIYHLLILNTEKQVVYRQNLIIQY